MMYAEVKIAWKHFARTCLREHVMKVINLENKKMKLSTEEQQESYENVKIC